MKPELISIIEEHVISELKDAYNEDGLMNCIDIPFIDFDWDLWEIVKGIIPENDDSAYDRIMEEAESIAKAQFNATMDKITTAFMILDGALNITGK
jgi:hypothetical protein